MRAAELTIFFLSGIAGPTPCGQAAIKKAKIATEQVPEPAACYVLSGPFGEANSKKHFADLFSDAENYIFCK